MANKQATILLSLTKGEDLSLIKGDVIVVDQGAAIALKNKLKIHYAIGDFDSLSPINFKKLTQLNIPVEKFPKEKNESDAELAFLYAKKQQYDSVDVLGFSGGRLDHQQSLIQVLFRLKDPRITFKTKDQTVQYVGPGKLPINRLHSNGYFSIFTLSKAEVTIENALYPLKHQSIDVSTTYTLSNQWLNQKPAVLTIHSGEILLFLSRLA
jgi:thiamine pyrophosphokinase